MHLLSQLTISHLMKGGGGKRVRSSTADPSSVFSQDLEQWLQRLASISNDKTTRGDARAVLDVGVGVSPVVVPSSSDNSPDIVGVSSFSASPQSRGRSPSNGRRLDSETVTQQTSFEGGLPPLVAGDVVGKTTGEYLVGEQGWQKSVDQSQNGVDPSLGIEANVWPQNIGNGFPRYRGSHVEQSVPLSALELPSVGLEPAEPEGDQKPATLSLASDWSQEPTAKLTSSIRVSAVKGELSNDRVREVNVLDAHQKAELPEKLSETLGGVRRIRSTQPFVTPPQVGRPLSVSVGASELPEDTGNGGATSSGKKNAIGEAHAGDANRESRRAGVAPIRTTRKSIIGKQTPGARVDGVVSLRGDKVGLWGEMHNLVDHDISFAEQMTEGKSEYVPTVKSGARDGESTTSAKIDERAVSESRARGAALGNRTTLGDNETAVLGIQHPRRRSIFEALRITNSNKSDGESPQEAGHVLGRTRMTSTGSSPSDQRRDDKGSSVGLQPTRGDKESITVASMPERKGSALARPTVTVNGRELKATATSVGSRSGVMEDTEEPVSVVNRAESVLQGRDEFSGVAASKEGEKQIEQHGQQGSLEPNQAKGKGLSQRPEDTVISRTASHESVRNRRLFEPIPAMDRQPHGSEGQPSTSVGLSRDTSGTLQGAWRTDVESGAQQKIDIRKVMASAVIDQKHRTGQKAVSSEAMEPEKEGRAVQQAPHEATLSKVSLKSPRGIQDQGPSILQFNKEAPRDRGRAEELFKGKLVVPNQPGGSYTRSSPPLASITDRSASKEGALPGGAQSGKAGSTARTGVRPSVVVDQDQRAEAKDVLLKTLEPEKRGRFIEQSRPEENVTKTNARLSKERSRQGASTSRISVGASQGADQTKGLFEDKNNGVRGPHGSQEKLSPTRTPPIKNGSIDGESELSSGTKSRGVKSTSFPENRPSGLSGQYRHTTPQTDSSASPKPDKKGRVADRTQDVARVKSTEPQSSRMQGRMAVEVAESVKGVQRASRTSTSEIKVLGGRVESTEQPLTSSVQHVDERSRVTKNLTLGASKTTFDTGDNYFKVRRENGSLHRGKESGLQRGNFTDSSTGAVLDKEYVASEQTGIEKDNTLRNIRLYVSPLLQDTGARRHQAQSTVSERGPIKSRETSSRNDLSSPAELRAASKVRPQKRRSVEGGTEKPEPDRPDPARIGDTLVQGRPRAEAAGVVQDKGQEPGSNRPSDYSPVRAQSLKEPVASMEGTSRQEKGLRVSDARLVEPQNVREYTPSNTPSTSVDSEDVAAQDASRRIAPEKVVEHNIQEDSKPKKNAANKASVETSRTSTRSEPGSQPGILRTEGSENGSRRTAQENATALPSTKQHEVHGVTSALPNRESARESGHDIVSSLSRASKALPDEVVASAKLDVRSRAQVVDVIRATSRRVRGGTRAEDSGKPVSAGISAEYDAQSSAKAELGETRRPSKGIAEKTSQPQIHDQQAIDTTSATPRRTRRDAKVEASSKPVSAKTSAGHDTSRLAHSQANRASESHDAQSSVKAESGETRQSSAEGIAERTAQPQVHDMRAVGEAHQTVSNRAVELVERAERVREQVSQSLRLMFREGETKMTVTLQPRDLGKVIVELVREEQFLSAALRVDTPETKELLESSIAALRSTLDGQGIKVEEFTVSLNREDLPTPEHRGEGGSQREIVAGDSSREETRFGSLTEQPLAADQPRLFGYNTMELIA